jgi:hypothetical protein
MQASATRIWTSARVVALAIIAILAQAWPTSGSGLGRTRSRSPTARRPAICSPRIATTSRSRNGNRRGRAPNAALGTSPPARPTVVSEVEIP